MSELTTRLELFAAASHSQRKQFVASLKPEERDAWPYDFLNTAHPGQLPPPGDWLVWLVMGGRGFGKTRAGAEWVRSIADRDPDARIALVGASLSEVRSVMVEGESGLIACSPDSHRPSFEPSLHRLRWPNGAQAFLYSAAEPEKLRGPQHSHACRASAKRILRQRSARPDRRAAPCECERFRNGTATVTFRKRGLACAGRSDRRLGRVRSPYVHILRRRLALCSAAQRDDGICRKYRAKMPL